MKTVYYCRATCIVYAYANTIRLALQIYCLDEEILLGHRRVKECEALGDVTMASNT